MFRMTPFFFTSEMLQLQSGNDPNLWISLLLIALNIFGVSVVSIHPLFESLVPNQGHRGAAVYSMDLGTKSTGSMRKSTGQIT